MAPVLSSKNGRVSSKSRWKKCGRKNRPADINRWGHQKTVVEIPGGNSGGPIRRPSPPLRRSYGG